MLSNHPSINNESNRPSSTENLIQSKEERFSVIIPLASARRTLPVIDTTFVVKLEESKNTTANSSPQVEVVPIESLPTAEVVPIESLPAAEVVPIESLPAAEVVPIESLPTAEVETTPSYSQPKLPARLYFSPTLLQDDDEPELIPSVLSTIDQNQTSRNKTNFSHSSNFFPFLDNEKPRINPRRFGQTFLLDNIKHEELNESEDTENLRPKISDEIPFMIHCDPTVLPENEVLNESHHLEIIEHQ